MARDFLARHGIDIDAEMGRIQSQDQLPSTEDLDSNKKTDIDGRTIDAVFNVCLPHTEAGSLWDVHFSEGRVASIQRRDSEHERQQNRHNPSMIDGGGSLLAPSLCHPHVHLDKAFLLAHPKYSHLQIEQGTFNEAMEVTNKAKAAFSEDDLLERGTHLVDESVKAGVTHMRAFVEVDPIVNFKCLNVARAIRKTILKRNCCDIQICAFAQLPLFSADDGGEEIRRLMTEATNANYSAEAVGSTPYVESSRERMEQNVSWMIDLALTHNKHLDFHLDYNLDATTTPLIWHVIRTLHAKNWSAHAPNRTVVLGHCTRLTLFTPTEWKTLAHEIGDLPISFVGLPTSDLYMMKSATNTRGTLPIPTLIKDYGLNAAIGINNIGNAFTPQGSCDPLYLASLAVGVYQAGTKDDAEVLYECVSTRARAAIGMSDGGDEVGRGVGLKIQEGLRAGLVLFPKEKVHWRTKRSVADAVYFYDGCKDRKVIFEGRIEP